MKLLIVDTWSLQISPDPVVLRLIESLQLLGHNLVIIKYEEGTNLMVSESEYDYIFAEWPSALKVPDVLKIEVSAHFGGLSLSYGGGALFSKHFRWYSSLGDQYAGKEKSLTMHLRTNDDQTTFVAIVKELLEDLELRARAYKEKPKRSAS